MKLLVIFAAFLAFFGQQSRFAYATPEVESISSTHCEIDNLSKRILLKELEVIRYSILFRLNNNIQGRWRGWRYFMSQETKHACTLTGLLVGIEARAGRLNQPFKISRTKLRDALVPQFVGQVIAASGSGIELGINAYHDFKAHRKGFGAKQAMKKIIKAEVDIHKMLNRRKKLISQDGLTGEYKKLLEAEGEILKDIRDIGLIEFRDFLSGSRRFRRFQDSLYFYDLVASTTGAVGNLIIIKRFNSRNPRLNGPGGIMAAISASFIIAAPILARINGKLVGKMHERLCKDCVKRCRNTDYLKLERDIQHLRNVLAENSLKSDLVDNITIRAALYSEHLFQQREQLAMNTREIRAGTRSATQNLTAATLVGSTKIVLGTNTAIAGFKYSDNLSRTAKLVQSGAITYSVGKSFAIAENLRLRYVDERNRRKLGKLGQLPEQVLNHRIQCIGEIESKVK